MDSLTLGMAPGQGGLGWAAVHDKAVLKMGGKPRQGISFKMTLVHLDLVCGHCAHLVWVVGMHGMCAGGSWASW